METSDSDVHTRSHPYIELSYNMRFNIEPTNKKEWGFKPPLCTYNYVKLRKGQSPKDGEMNEMILLLASNSQAV